MFLSASTGGGHSKAAEAVIESMNNRCPGLCGHVVDTLKHISPILDRLVIGTYLKTVKNRPGIYGKFYNLSESDENITDITKIFNKLISVKLLGFLKEYAPSIIVCTHTFPLQMLSSLKQKGAVSIPVIGIVTDYANHLFWKLDGVDAFIVAHEYLKNDMIKMGIPEEKVFAYGIPVSQGFLVKKDRQQLTKELGVKNKLTMLIMGGSLGIGELKDVFSSLQKSSRDMQIIAIAGYNRKLKEELEALASHSAAKDIKILGYTNRISDFMDISDYIITKPGGVTISEALVKKLPIIIMSPIPGQEERNARFLTNTGAAARIYRNEGLENVLCQVIDNPLRLKHMCEMAEYLAKPDASNKIADLILNFSYPQNIVLARNGFPCARAATPL